MIGRVTALHIHPIKSCRRIAVARARVERLGLEHDRRWMIVDPSGAFVTQREEPRLARVEVDLVGDQLRVRAPGASELVMPLSIGDGAPIEVTIWGTRVHALAHEEGGVWFSAYLGRPVRLVHMHDGHARPLAPKHAREGDVVSFADGFPLLLASEASLDDLNARAGQPLSMARFRPNVSVAGFEPWAEESWSRIRIGQVVFRAPKLCERCPITTIDPETGVMGKEPLRTLATFRKRDNKVWFAINLVPELPEGRAAEIRLDDAVEPDPAEPD